MGVLAGDPWARQRKGGAKAEMENLGLGMPLCPMGHFPQPVSPSGKRN